MYCLLASTRLTNDICQTARAIAGVQRLNCHPLWVLEATLEVLRDEKPVICYLNTTVRVGQSTLLAIATSP